MATIRPLVCTIPALYFYSGLAKPLYPSTRRLGEVALQQHYLTRDSKVISYVLNRQKRLFRRPKPTSTCKFTIVIIEYETDAILAAVMVV